MVFNSEELRLDAGSCITATKTDNVLTVYYTKEGCANACDVDLSVTPPTTAFKGKLGYCVQATPLGSKSIRVYGNDVRIE